MDVSLLLFMLGNSISYKIASTPSKNADQPVYPCCLIRIFAWLVMFSDGQQYCMVVHNDFWAPCSLDGNVPRLISDFAKSLLHCTFREVLFISLIKKLKLTLATSNSLISNNCLSRSENLVPVLTQRCTNRQQNIVEGEIAR